MKNTQNYDNRIVNRLDQVDPLTWTQLDDNSIFANTWKINKKYKTTTIVLYNDAISGDNLNSGHSSFWLYVGQDDTITSSSTNRPGSIGGANLWSRIDSYLISSSTVGSNVVLTMNDGNTVTIDLSNKANVNNPTFTGYTKVAGTLSIVNPATDDEILYTDMTKKTINYTSNYTNTINNSEEIANVYYVQDQMTKINNPKFTGNMTLKNTDNISLQMSSTDGQSSYFQQSVGSGNYFASLTLDLDLDRGAAITSSSDLKINASNINLSATGSIFVNNFYSSGDVILNYATSVTAPTLPITDTTNKVATTMFVWNSVSNKVNHIELQSITSTPDISVQISQNDKYYDSTTKKIYTCIGMDTQQYPIYDNGVLPSISVIYSFDSIDYMYDYNGIQLYPIKTNLSTYAKTNSPTFTGDVKISGGLNIVNPTTDDEFLFTDMVNLKVNYASNYTTFNQEEIANTGFVHNELRKIRIVESSSNAPYYIVPNDDGYIICSDTSILSGGSSFVIAENSIYPIGFSISIYPYSKTASETAYLRVYDYDMFTASGIITLTDEGNLFTTNKMLKIIKVSQTLWIVDGDISGL